MPPIICTLYNHKGGVSKTTTTFNLAHALAEKGHKVILVDADPQCNLTELFLGQKMEQLDLAEEETGQQQEIPGTSILKAIESRLSGGGHFVNVETVELIPSEYQPSVSLLRGDIDLINVAEDILARAHLSRLGHDMHDKYNYIVIHDMLRRLAEHHQANFVLIDVGPSAGAITRSCFLACDAFFVPVMADRFNVQAIGSLAKILEKWVQEHQEIVTRYRKLGLNASDGAPYFLGIIYQNFKKINNKAKKGFELWMKRIPGKYAETLGPALERLSGECGRDLLRYTHNRGIGAAEIPDFARLAPLMQELSKPIFGISQADTAKISGDGRPFSGSVWTNAEERIASNHEKFGQLADFLFEVAENG